MRTSCDRDGGPPPDGAGAAAPAALSMHDADAWALSFIAGFVDTAVFIGLFGLFTAHVTGNLVLIGSEMVHWAPADALPKLLAFGAFIAAVAAAVALDRWRRGAMGVPAFLVIEGTLLLLAVLACGWRVPADPNAWPALLCGSLAAAAMGIQNAMMRLRLTAVPSTTVMTTNVTQGVVDATTLLLPASDEAAARGRDAARRRLRRLWPQIAWFTFGAVAGTTGYGFLGLTSLVLPAFACAGLAWRIGRR